MATRSLYPTSGNQSRAPPGHNAVQDLDAKIHAKQWSMRKHSGDQENAWYPSYDHAAPFEHRISSVSRESVLKQTYDYRSQYHETMPRPSPKADRIITTTTTTQTLGKSYTYKDVARPLVHDNSRTQTIITAANSSSPETDEFAFDLDLQRNNGPQVWNRLDSSISLEIIEDYEDELYDEPRRPPSTLPPVPDLPLPDVQTEALQPRAPRTLEELEARRMVRVVSNESAGSEDPLDPDNQYATLSPPFLRTIPRSTTPGPFKAKTHQKDSSQSRLLPFHLNQPPFLTTDKPSPENVSYARTSDTVKIYWALLICFLFLPPLLLVLASGVFDEALHVPMLRSSGKIDSFASPDRQTFLSVRRIKKLAMAIGVVFWITCLVGFVLGLTL